MSVFGDHAPDGQHTDRFFLFHRHDSNDVNNKILLSAIITVSAVLFLVIVLHIYARFLLRRRLTVRRLPISARSVDAGAPTGLEPSAVAALPIITVQTAAEGGSGEGGAYGECAVCLSGLEVGEPARLLPNCNHAFHVKCIDTWLGSHCTCPICRAGVEPVASLVLPLSREPPASSQSLGKVGGPSSRLSSLRRMMSGEIPTRRVQQVGLEDQDGDVESQSQRQ